MIVCNVAKNFISGQIVHTSNSMCVCVCVRVCACVCVCACELLLVHKDQLNPTAVRVGSLSSVLSFSFFFLPSSPDGCEWSSASSFLVAAGGSAGPWQQEAGGSRRRQEAGGGGRRRQEAAGGGRRPGQQNRIIPPGISLSLRTFSDVQVTLWSLARHHTCFCGIILRGGHGAFVAPPRDVIFLRAVLPRCVSDAVFASMLRNSHIQDVLTEHVTIIIS